MDKENEYYNLIEDLVRRHKKYAGMDTILDNIIDYVYNESKYVIETANDDSVIEQYINRIISIALIKVPAELNFKPERPKTDIASIVPKNEDFILPDNQEDPVDEIPEIEESPSDNDEISFADDFDELSEITEIAEEAENISEKNYELYPEDIPINRDFVDQMINNASSEGTTEDNSDNTELSEQTIELIDSGAEEPEYLTGTDSEQLNINSPESNGDYIEERLSEYDINLQPETDLSNYNNEEISELESFATEIYENQSENDTFIGNSIFKPEEENSESEDFAELNIELNAENDTEKSLDDNTDTNAENIDTLTDNDDNTQPLIILNEGEENNNDNLQNPNELNEQISLMYNEDSSLDFPKTTKEEDFSELNSDLNIYSNNTIQQSNSIFDSQEYEIAEKEDALSAYEENIVEIPEGLSEDDRNDDTLDDGFMLDIDIPEEVIELNPMSEEEVKEEEKEQENKKLSLENSVSDNNEILSFEDDSQVYDIITDDQSDGNSTPENTTKDTTEDKEQSVNILIENINTEEIVNKLILLSQQNPDLKYLKIFDLKYKKGYTIAKISESLNLSEKTIIKALSEMVSTI